MRRSGAHHRARSSRSPGRPGRTPPERDPASRPGGSADMALEVVAPAPPRSPASGSLGSPSRRSVAGGVEHVRHGEPVRRVRGDVDRPGRPSMVGFVGDPSAVEPFDGVPPAAVAVPGGIDLDLPDRGEEAAHAMTDGSDQSPRVQRPRAGPIGMRGRRGEQGRDRRRGVEAGNRRSSASFHDAPWPVPPSAARSRAESIAKKRARTRPLPGVSNLLWSTTSGGWLNRRYAADGQAMGHPT